MLRVKSSQSVRRDIEPHQGLMTRSEFLSEPGPDLQMWGGGTIKMWLPLSATTNLGYDIVFIISYDN
jgi:hypothetical protein